jgi:RNA polymerase sigma-70 factor (ECF subfamily)
MTTPLPIGVPDEATRSFDALFDAYYKRLARLLYRVTGDIARAEEVAAEAFWRLHRKPPPATANLEGWLYRTGVRLALDQLKMDRRRVRYEALASRFGISQNPQQVLEQNEGRNRVQLTFAALKSEQTTLLLMRWEGLSYAELAHALGLNPASVGSALARAEEAFRKEYVKRYGPA